ncbi:MAG: hypothetical protein KKB59_20245 [Spirochaetes bacterium]|nr:hypothetical protein [Spirochaetota bacterium]
MAVEYGEFKGKRTIKLVGEEGDKFPFSFGKSKAKKIVENYEAIKEFAESED